MPDPKWMRGVHTEQSQRTRKKENSLAKSIGGKRMPGSGNRPLGARQSGQFLDSVQSLPNKRTTGGGDIDSKRFFIEHKRTDAQSMSVKFEWIQDICRAARRRSKEPGLALTFDHGEDAPRDWIAIPWATFQRLIGVEPDE